MKLFRVQVERKCSGVFYVLAEDRAGAETAAEQEAAESTDAWTEDEHDAVTCKTIDGETAASLRR